MTVFWDFMEVVAVVAGIAIYGMYKLKKTGRGLLEPSKDELDADAEQEEN